MIEKLANELIIGGLVILNLVCVIIIRHLKKKIDGECQDKDEKCPKYRLERRRQRKKR